MLKRILSSLKTKPVSGERDDDEIASPSKVSVLERNQHQISRKNISKGALNVLYDLNNAGFEAYLVGGGIRDLFLGLQPKDFDVATNATPEQIKRIFRRSRIVGRRFQIVHVRFGRELIEVTTFRAGHNSEADTETQIASGVTSQSGMLLRDNVFGSLEEDALRRDFTINALYYTVDEFKVLDYTGGLEDLENRVIRIIGDARTRYLEDPVRMLRAIRFAAKLEFQIETSTEAPIGELAPQIKSVSAARLFDEINKLFLNQDAVRCLELSQQYSLFAQLFPFTHAELQKSPVHQALIEAALTNTAQRIKENKPVTPAFLFAAILWPRVVSLLEKNQANGNTAQRAMQMAGFQTLDEQAQTITIPKRFAITIREIWGLQQNLLKTNNKRAITLLSHPRFRAAYDFLIIREDAGEKLSRSSTFWTDLQLKHPEALEQEYRKSQRQRRGRHRPSRNKRASAETQPTTPPLE